MGSFYDSNTGNELFTAPEGRSFEQFVKESRVHGWPSFRDDEVNWDYVRVCPTARPCPSTARTSSTTCRTITGTGTASTSCRSRVGRRRLRSLITCAGKKKE